MVNIDAAPTYQSPRPDEERIFNFRKTRQTSPNMSYTHSTTASSSETPLTMSTAVPSPIRIPKSATPKLNGRKSHHRGPPSPWDAHHSPRSETMGTNSNTTSPSRRRRDPSPPASAATTPMHEDIVLTSLEPEELLVCDYETAATTLYKLLESSQWDLALARIRSHPLEVRTWVQRSATDSPKTAAKATIRWKVLPLHAAIVFKAPVAIIECLLEQHAKAVTCRDDQGMLPLHLSFRHYDKDHERTIELLLERYPKAVHMPDKRGRNPLELAPESAAFSTKIMKLYTDATATKLPSPPDIDQLSIRKSATDPDALKLQDHGKVAGDFERRLDLLKQEHDANVKVLQRQNQKALVQVRLDAEDERQDLMKRHHQEMDELRDLLSREVGREGQMSASLQAEVTKLRAQLEQSRKKLSAMTSMMRGFRLYHEELLRHLRDEVLVDQQRLLDLAVQQHSELEAAYNMRNQLLRTVLQQDQEDTQLHNRSHQTILELAERLKLRVETMASVSQHSLLLDTQSASGESPPALQRAPPPTPPQTVQPKKTVAAGVPTKTDEGRNDDELSQAESDVVSALTDHSF